MAFNQNRRGQNNLDGAKRDVEQKSVVFSVPELEFFNGNVKKFRDDRGFEKQVYTNFAMQKLNDSIWEVVSAEVDVLNGDTKDLKEKEDLKNMYLNFESLSVKRGKREYNWSLILLGDNSDFRHGVRGSEKFNLINEIHLSKNCGEMVSDLIVEYVDLFFTSIIHLSSISLKENIPRDYLGIKNASFNGLSDVLQIYLKHCKKTYLKEVVSILSSKSDTVVSLLWSILSVAGSDCIFTHNNLKMEKFIVNEGGVKGFDRRDYVCEVSVRPCASIRISSLLRFRTPFVRREMQERELICEQARLSTRSTY